MLSLALSLFSPYFSQAYNLLNIYLSPRKNIFPEHADKKVFVVQGIEWTTKWKEIKSKTEYKKKSKDLTVHQINNISTLNMRKRKISPNNF